MKITAATTFLDEYNRYEEGESYDVTRDRGQYFVNNGWAYKAASDVEMSEPWDTRTATDEDAEQSEREVNEPARAANTVETFNPETGLRYLQTGDASGEPTVITEPSKKMDEQNVLLDVQDTESGQGTLF